MSSRTLRATFAASALAMLSSLALACSGDAEVPISERPRPDDHQLTEGPTSPRGYLAILGTDDLNPGQHRIGFVLISPLGVVNEPVVSVTLLSGEPGGEREVAGPFDASYQPWPVGSRGLYTTFVEFEQSGPHRLSISAPTADGGVEMIDLPFTVNADTSAPNVGDQAIRSETKTLDNVDDPADLTTGSHYDPSLYRLTLASAISDDRPVVVVFASPAFCINAVCGPQVEVISELREAYGDRVHFVHVDLYANPREIQGDLGKAVISPAVWDWGLPSNEWTFVIDGDGRIAARFEAFATYAEIERALTKVLPEASRL